MLNHMKTLIVSFAAAVALIVPAAAFSDGGLQAPAHVSGTALIVPNNMMCVRGAVCNAYHGQVVFCHSFPGMMATAVPCKTPAATVLTSANGKYSAVVAAGNYNTCTSTASSTRG